MPLAEPEDIRADVLIIGAGLAGCRAAIAAAEGGGRKVLVLSKGRFAVSGSSFHPLGPGVGMSATVPEDSPETHFQDILAAGSETCDHRWRTSWPTRRLRDWTTWSASASHCPTSRPAGGHIHRVCASTATHAATRRAP